MKKTAWYLGWTLIAISGAALIGAAAEYVIVAIAGFLLNDGYRGYQIPGFNLRFEFLWIVCFAIGAWVACRIVVQICRSAALKEAQLADSAELESHLMRALAR